MRWTFLARAFETSRAARGWSSGKTASLATAGLSHPFRWIAFRRRQHDPGQLSLRAVEVELLPLGRRDERYWQPDGLWQLDASCSTARRAMSQPSSVGLNRTSPATLVCRPSDRQSCHHRGSLLFVKPRHDQRNPWRGRGHGFGVSTAGDFLTMAQRSAEAPIISLPRLTTTTQLSQATRPSRVSAAR